jgi:hypothetical protein
VATHVRRLRTRLVLGGRDLLGLRELLLLRRWLGLNRMFGIHSLPRVVFRVLDIARLRVFCH